MTPSRYILARIAQAFGYVRRNHRMSEAAAESHLLREAETYLGMSVWDNVESIDELTVEYWNLRKLIKERDEVDRKATECQQRLTLSHQERAELINGTPEEKDDLMRERAECMERIEQLARERDGLVSEARDARRIYMGTKTKLEVISKERGGDSLQGVDLQRVEEINSHLADIRKRFEELKDKRAKVGEQIENAQCALASVVERQESLRQARRERAAEAFQVISEMNKELSRLRAEGGVLDVRMRQMYSHIGKHVSFNALSDSKCAAAAKKQLALVHIMKALRRSVDLNQKLAGLDS